MKTGANSTLYEYWNGLRADRIAPRRFEIEPAQIADILPDTFILELSEPGTFVYRLAGTRVCEIFGQEMRGENFLEGWREPDRFALNRNLNVCRRNGGVLQLFAETPQDKAASRRFEIVVLPLLHNGDSIERFLGGIVALSPRQPAAEGVHGQLHAVEHELIYPRSEPVADMVSNLGLRTEEPLVFETVRNARIVRQDRRQFRVYEGGLSGFAEED